MTQAEKEAEKRYPLKEKDTEIPCISINDIQLEYRQVFIEGWNSRDALAKEEYKLLEEELRVEINLKKTFSMAVDRLQENNDDKDSRIQQLEEALKLIYSEAVSISDRSRRIIQGIAWNVLDPSKQ